MEINYFYLLFIPVSLWIVFMVVHIILLHVRKGNNIIYFFIIPFIFFAILVFFITVTYMLDKIQTRHELITLALTNTFLFCSLAYGYFTIFNLNASSLRIRILKEIASSSTGLEISNLLQEYNSHVIIANRIQRLTQGKQVKVIKDRLYVDKPGFLMLAIVMDTLKLILMRKRKDV